MLRVNDCVSMPTPPVVEVGDEISLIARTTPSPVEPVLYRVGDFKTSLVEIPIDPQTGAVRGIRLVNIGRASRTFAWEKIERKVGLPVLAKEDVPSSPLDETRDLNVGLVGDAFIVDWGAPLAGKWELLGQGRLHFLIGDGMVQGAVISNLAPNEVESLKLHISRAPQFE